MSFKDKIVLLAFDHKYYWLIIILLTQNEIEELLAFMDKIGMPKSEKFDA
jgi:hypothetical protein